MIKLGLLGAKLEHSYSKVIHETHLSMRGMRVLYQLIECGENQLSHYLSLLRSGKYSGLNVTIPYKEKVIPLLDILSDEAKEIQAVNTIVCRNGLLFGYNTDAFGFEFLLNYHQVPLGVNNYILGNGGASKACSYILRKRGVQYSIVSLSPTKDELSYDELGDKEVDLIINTTPVGMYPLIDSSSISEDIARKAKCIIDIIYNPLETRLMKYNANSFNGIIMLIYQAIASEAIWFDTEYKIDDSLIELVISKIKG